MSKQFLEYDLSDFSNTNKEQKSLAEIRRDAYTDGFMRGKAEGRADAIDELMPYLKSDKYDYEQIIAKAEQIKGEQND